MIDIRAKLYEIDSGRYEIPVELRSEIAKRIYWHDALMGRALDRMISQDLNPELWGYLESQPKPPPGV